MIQIILLNEVLRDSQTSSKEFIALNRFSLLGSINKNNHRKDHQVINLRDYIGLALVFLLISTNL